MAPAEAARRRPVIAGNWKMNGLSASGQEILLLRDRLGQAPAPPCEVVVCPPATLLHAFSELTAETPIALGGQDCHAEPKGAHTGDISAPMLADAGARWVIVGHSERRADHGETSAQVAAKAQAGQAAGLNVIICVGETEAQRIAGETLDVIGSQLTDSIPHDPGETGGLVIAYEPVWAIGTGRVPGPEDIVEVHEFIRTHLDRRFGDKGADIRILYGGSVKPGNASEILRLTAVDGALVGGASLKADDFFAIITACP